MSRSLRFHLLRGMIGAVALLLALFGIVVYTVISHELQRGFDASLVAAANAIAASVAFEDGVVEVEIGTEEVAALDRGQRPLCFQVWLDDDVTLMRSASLGQTDLSRFAGDIGEPAFRATSLPGNRPARAVGIRFHPAIEQEYEYDDDDEEDLDEPEDVESQGTTDSVPEVVLVVAGDTTALRGRTRALLWLLLIAWAITMGVAWWVSSIIVGRGLRPLNAMAQQIAAVREEDLAARVSADDVPIELAPVVEKLNDLLHRLEAAFRRQRGFTADVAHELRTPLAGIRTTIEVALARQRDQAEYAEALTDSLDIARRMGATVENLLTLSRLDAGKITFRCEQIDVARLVDACWQPLAQRAQVRGLTFESRVPKDAVCLCDKDSLTTVVTNLLDNAVEYADDGGRIVAAVQYDDDAARISIANTGCTMSNEQVAHVFDEFWRADASRSGAGVHCGLGLALVKRIVNALAGSTTAECDQSGQFVVHITLKAG